MGTLVSQKSNKHKTETRSWFKLEKVADELHKPIKRNFTRRRVSCRGLLLLSGIIKNTCEEYKGSVFIEPEQAIEKADYKCGKSFCLDPILGTYKKKIIENPIVDKIFDMIAKANIDRLDFGRKKITNNHSHVVFTNEDKYQNYKPDPDSKTKIIYSRKLFQYGDMVGLRYY